MKVSFVFFAVAMAIWGYQQGNYFWIGTGIALFAIGLSNLNDEQEDDEQQE